MDRLVTTSLFLLLTFLGSAAFAQFVDKIECPKVAPKIPDVARSDVYKDMPFKAGETSTYEVSYKGITAGSAVLEVKPPVKYDGSWHRVYHGEARTGEWFEKIFIGHYVVDAIVRPWDYAISKFYLEQNEGHMFSSPVLQKKWLEFDHKGCKVNEKVQKTGKEDETDTHDLSYGAKDILGTAEYMRTLVFKVGEKQRAMVYTSEKNWWLEAEPLAIEKIETKVGKFDAMKLKLQTFVGKELQQKGDVHVWFNTADPKQLVQVQAEIKIGSMYMVLTEYKPGG